MEQIMQVQAVMNKNDGRSHRSLQLGFHTNENLTDEQISAIASWYEKTGWLTFSVPFIKADKLMSLPKLDPDEGKSPSQRLRACLFRLWEQRGKTDDFEMFYRIQMSRFIDVVKEKLT